MRHLPNIFDDHVGLCIPYPDHRSSRDEAENTRRLLLYIPRFPYGQGWRTGVLRDMLTENLRVYSIKGEKLQKNSKCWSRIKKHGLCRTITTTITPQCSRTGTYVHYDQPRLITVHEARIAQGFPDDEVLVGNPSQRFKVVGNSVARGVSIAMGVALRKAYFGEWDD
jgi:DNA (cytosine-5)-methyltransferase 1